MITTVLFDIGGTLLTVKNSPELRTAFAGRLKARLALYGIEIGMPDEEFGLLLHDRGEEYKHWGERNLRELPQPVIWNEYFLRDFAVGEEKLAPYAEELSFLYDYDRVQNIRRPDVAETVDALSAMGLRQGIISNVMSTSFAPHIVKEYGIEKQMELILMSSEAGCRKPDPAIFRLACDRMGISLSELCYVGDTISRDVLGCRRAGVGLVIQISNPSVAHRDAMFKDDPNAPKPDFLVQELKEIPEIIRKWNERTPE